jgi:hypothetical protein
MSKIFQCIIASILIALSAVIFENTKQMSPVWTVPFLSGAAHYTLGGEWYFSPTDLSKYDSLSTDEKEAYKFQAHATEELIKYGHNPIGYVFIIAIAKKIFFWVGDVKAIKLFQVLIHTLTTLFIFLLYKPIERWLFLLFYGVNPLILYFVTFPFAYFWLTIPSAVFIYLILKNWNINLYSYILIGLLMAIALSIRPTFVLLLPLLFIWLFIKAQKTIALIFCILTMAITFLFINKSTDNKTIWHTIYIGIGAYPNPYSINELSDNTAYELFFRETGQILDARPGGNFYNKQVFTHYSNILKNTYLSILSSSPFLLLRNAILNFFQSFSLGYFVDYPLWVSYLSSLVGFTFFMLLLMKRHFIWILAIALNSLTFTPYFPPIQAYMFGGYILLVGAFIQLLQDFKLIQKLDKWIQNSKYYAKFTSV